LAQAGWVWGGHSKAAGHFRKLAGREWFRKIRVEIEGDTRYTWGMMANTLVEQAGDYRRVEQAIRYLQGNFHAHPSLDEIAESVHLSKYHFQRLFKRWAGISPSQFLQFLTLEYAKQQLLASRSVMEVSLEAGLSGPGRLHDLFVTFEAVTPGEYKQRGAGLQIQYGFHDTPFGECLLARTERGICNLFFVQEGGSSRALEQLYISWPRADFLDRSSETQLVVDRIFAPAGAEPMRPFHLLLKGTNFQVNVWRALLSIPPGAMVSYQDAAKLAGRPDATRAVANAISRNPIAYLIPCHRVISKSGQVHCYRWGVPRKRAILGWEASRAMARPIS
jgi:AraC family transcriptional regulator of adaptative response/methylated-DNA-[protein]-cysteine methyltransferase